MIDDFSIGFELEFCTDEPNRIIKADINKLFGQHIWVSKTQRKTSSVKDYPYGAFTLYRDNTIEPDYATQYEWELVTPVWSLTNGRENLRKLFKWMRNDISVTTNETTGLHFSISSPLDFDKIQLIKAVDENKWLKLFGRQNNEFCRPHNLKKTILRYERDRAISFRRKRYVEFRMCGGKDYHERLLDVDNCIMHCVNCF